MRDSDQPDFWPEAAFEDAIARVRAAGFDDSVAYACALAEAIEQALTRSSTRARSEDRRDD